MKRTLRPGLAPVLPAVTGFNWFRKSGSDQTQLVSHFGPRSRDDFALIQEHVVFQ